ncbi:adenylate cyclase associated N terminal-domain-containing protein [Pyronema domesticum]|uniref:Adenylyl cyclase-associated protein n=1 Tax=Pyronema omphalodes (strain CBS 100304) TaxID=1076935 RepID=U4LN66_PYROM|nr:adenylate cyclase associated N terminal-domain-containing protein [Pyronema domesticum]CCX15860.1 Similar to Adenylyl cyclase-associated protein; acc. no. P36621 [Pyronema omphalodes CBS 100304]
MAQPNQMNNLTTLIKRLEAATSRLEDLTTIIPPPGSDATSISSAVPAQGTRATIPALQDFAPVVAAPPAPKPPVVELPASIEEFDELIAKQVALYVQYSQQIGGLVAEQSKAVESCFAEQRKFLIITLKAKKPEAGSEAGSNLLMQLLSGMQAELTKVSNIRENNRASPLFNQISAVSEGMPALAWVTFDTKPADIVKEMRSAAEFYGNRVLKEHNQKDDVHNKWIQSFYDVLKALEAYVKQHHLMGVTWNYHGIDAAEALAASSSSPISLTVAGGAPPPPPPPPPPGPINFDGPSSPLSKVSSGGDMGSVFEQLNRGTSVTAGLKKVDKSQMTHKNPELRNNSIVSVQSRPGSSGSLRGKSPAPPLKSKPASLTKRKPAKIELEGNKWIVENFENDQNIIIDNTELNHSVFIFRCKNSTIQVKGKVNLITINECVKTNVVADSLVSGIELIKSYGFAIQVLGKVPNVQIDQCDGGQVYVSEESLDVEVFTSKTSAVNIYIPNAGEDGDSAERAVPEQLKHTIRNGQLVSEIVEHAG